GPKGKIWVIRRPEERNHPDYIIEKEVSTEKDQKQIYCWAAIGYNFNSPLI
ncbi:hypothetical protein QR685DRAFT_435940, partial [Neurospora intermedia]